MMTRLMTIVVAVVAMVAPPAMAGTVGGNFELDGFQVGYNLDNRLEDGVPAASTWLSVRSNVHRVENAWANIYPTGKTPEGLPAFGLSLQMTGRRDKFTPGVGRNESMSFNYQRPPVVYNQFTQTGTDHWVWDDGTDHWEDGGHVSVGIQPAVLEWGSLNYNEWVEGGGGGGGGGIGSNEPPTSSSVVHWNWSGFVSGYFTDIEAGNRFLATVPEPTGALLALWAAMPVLVRRRRTR